MSNQPEEQRTARSLPRPLSICNPVADRLIALVGSTSNIPSSVVELALCETFPTQYQQVRLYLEVAKDPTVIGATTSTADKRVTRFVEALRQRGAKIPGHRCVRCGNHRPLRRRDDTGALVCDACKGNRGKCPNCGTTKSLGHRDTNGRAVCAKCRSDEDPRGELVALLVRNYGFTTHDADELVLACAPKRGARLVLASEVVRDDVDVIAEPQMSIHPVVTRLAVGIRGVYDRLPPIRCGECGVQTDRINYRSKNNVRCCRKCYESQRRKNCCRCGKLRDVVRRTEDGKPLCGSCSSHESIVTEECTECGRIAQIVKRTTSENLCRRCWRGETMHCKQCGRLRACNQSRKCEECVAANRPPERCVKCDIEKPVKRRTEEGPLCAGCVVPEKRACVFCQRTTRKYKRTETGYACYPCLHRSPARRVCQECGLETALLMEATCSPCRAANRIYQELGIDRGVSPPTDAAIDALSQYPRWVDHAFIRETDGLGVLLDILPTMWPITHEVIDDHPLSSSRSVNYLRSIFVSQGVLPDRDEISRRLEKEIDRTLSTLRRNEDQFLISGYADRLYKRFQRRAQGSRSTPRRRQLSRDYLLRSVTSAIDFMDHIHDSGYLLSNVPLSEIVDYSINQQKRNQWIRPFLRYAGIHLNRDLHTVIGPPNYTVPPLVSETDQNIVLRTLVKDPDIDPRARFVGLLVVLLGQIPESILGFTTDDIRENGTEVLLKLGTDEFPLDGPFAETASEVIRMADRHWERFPVVNQRWLFPSRVPGGHPLTVGTIRDMTAKHGLEIGLLRSRLRARHDLASQLPASVLISTLGMSPRAAVKWETSSGGSYRSYPSQPTRRTESTGWTSPPTAGPGRQNK